MAVTDQLINIWEKLKVQSKVGLAQAIFYFLSVIASFFVCVPIGIVLRNFSGRCILFAQVVWDGMTIYPWSESACDFTLYNCLGANMIYALLMGLFTLFAVLPRTQKTVHIRKVGEIQATNARYVLTAINPVFLLVNTIVAFLTLCQAVVITVGFAEFCDSLVNSREELHNDYAARYPLKDDNPYKVVTSCYDIDDIDWKKMNIDGGGDGVNGSNFRYALLIAVIGSWALVVIWFLQLMLNFGQCCRGCSCDKAEEKQKVSKSMMVAQRRSRMATPIGTPGHMTPRGFGVPGHMTPPVMGPPPGAMHHQPQHGHGQPYHPGHHNMGYEMGVGHGPLPPKV